MIKRIFVLILYFLSCASFANQQYSEGTCILLKNQVKEFSAYPQSKQYKSAKRSVDKHCVNPSKVQASPQSIPVESKPSTTLSPLKISNKLNTDNSTKAHEEPIMANQMSKTPVQPLQGVLDLVLKIGIWVLVLSFGFALAKAFITLLAKRAAKSLLNKITGRIEPKLEPLVSDSNQASQIKTNVNKPILDTMTTGASVLKETIAEIVANDPDPCISKGLNGEDLVNQHINEFIRDGRLAGVKNFTQYSNVLLTNETDELTEIDHLIVSPMGVFVIESKNYSGFIFGSQHQAKWTQTLKGHKTQFMNPLRQNHKHCLAVSRLLGVVDGVESLVLFHDKASFKTALPNNVRYVSELTDYLRGFKETKFSQNQLDEFNNRLAKVISVTTQLDFKQHIDEVKTKWNNA